MYHTARRIEDEVFDLLKQRGPLDVSQICVELLRNTTQVLSALEVLRHERSVAIRPDPDRKNPDNELLVVWGLPVRV